jgi:hypothetical protein
VVRPPPGQAFLSRHLPSSHGISLPFRAFPSPVPRLVLIPSASCHRVPRFIALSSTSGIIPGFPHPAHPLSRFRPSQRLFPAVPPPPVKAKSAFKLPLSGGSPPEKPVSLSRSFNLRAAWPFRGGFRIVSPRAAASRHLPFPSPFKSHPLLKRIRCRAPRSVHLPGDFLFRSPLSSLGLQPVHRPVLRSFRLKTRPTEAGFLSHESAAPSEVLPLARLSFQRPCGLLEQNARRFPERVLPHCTSGKS